MIYYFYHYFLYEIKFLIFLIFSFIVLETILNFHLPDGLISEFNKGAPEEFVLFPSK